MTAFSRAVEAMGETVRQVAGEPATYHRGSDSASIDKIVPGETGVQVDDRKGTTVRAKKRDWLIKASALVINEVAIKPAIGDRIKVTVADGLDVYEVSELAGEVCRWWDRGKTTWRIHTRFMTTEAV
jgi:hypothetical protein